MRAYHGYNLSNSIPTSLLSGLKLLLEAHVFRVLLQRFVVGRQSLQFFSAV